MTTALARSMPLLCALTLVTGCAVQKQYRTESGAPRLLKVNQTLAVEEAQPKILLRLASNGSLEARFEEAPICTISEITTTPNYEIEERSLSTFDTVLMWSSYGAAAVIGGFVGTGLVRGGDPATGAKLFAMYGLPLAAVGAVESYRALDRKTELEPTHEAIDRGLRRCAIDKEGMPVKLRRSMEEKVVMLSTGFRELSRADGKLLSELIGEETEASLRTSVPLLIEAESLVALLDGPIMTRAVEPTPQETPVLLQEEPRGAAIVQVSTPGSSPTPSKKPVATEPAALAVAMPDRNEPSPRKHEPAEHNPPSVNGNCAIRETKYGPASTSFFEQPVKSYRLKQGDWLSKVAKRIWGDAIEYRQLHLLNADIANPNIVFAGTEILVPQAPKQWSDWRGEIESCSEETGN